MEFRTKVEVDRPPFFISHSDKLMFAGSCFADEIGRRFREFRYDALVNPFGVLFNPVSIALAIKRMANSTPFDESVVTRHNDLYFSWMHSGLFSSYDKNLLLEDINNKLEVASDHFRDSSVVLLTLGTAWVYRLKSSGEVVANCHKESASSFDREFISPEDVFNSLSGLIEMFRNKRWILTVSPVRHFKDGARGNILSKSSLHLGVSQLERALSNVSYFPAYEIVNDELRDYRFYATDMLHPSESAVNYIWERFCESYIDPDESDLNMRIARCNAMFNHRAQFPESSEFKKFAEQRERLSESIDKEILKLSLKRL